MAVALVVPAAAGAWRAASLRGDINHKWAERVDITYAGLSEAAVRELVALQGEISGLLGGTDEFNPALLTTVDPGPLTARSDRFGELIRARNALRRRFRRHRRLGPLLLAMLGIYIVGWAMDTIYFAKFAHSAVLEYAGFVFAGAALVGAIAVFGLYAYYENRLASAEILVEHT